MDPRFPFGACILPRPHLDRAAPWRAARLLPFVFLCLIFGATSCRADRGGTLNGSLQDFYDTSYERVRVRLYSSEVAIEYVREDGEVPVRVSVLRGPHLVAGQSIDIDVDARGDITGRSRDTDMPPITSGSITFEEFGLADGTSIVGEFSASFDVGGDEASLSGTFDAPMEVVPQVQGYDLDLGSDAGDGVSDMDMPGGEQ